MRERRESRRRILMALFRERHGGRKPETPFEMWCFNTAVGVGAIYDITTDERRSLQRRNKLNGNLPYTYQRREAKLNQISHDIRHLLNIGLMDKDPTDSEMKARRALEGDDRGKNSNPKKRKKVS